MRDQLQRAMTTGAGVLRSASSLAETDAVVEHVAAAATDGPAELHNLLVTGWALLAAATAREESRGAHYRNDFPLHSPAARHSVMQQGRLDFVA